MSISADPKKASFKFIDKVWIADVKKMALLIVAASFLLIVTIPAQTHSHQLIQLHDQIGGI
ncbi:hypothetical protein [Paenibacillus sp. BJ-4]|uniref:hypothetical protein n=1 Tax=Paenibacillus sp. BJ-4 TaxID=2878097 RepID=UPI001CF020C3|nr:hypothetical protein [Paenibacillus sp. BJ-4]